MVPDHDDVFAIDSRDVTLGILTCLLSILYFYVKICQENTWIMILKTVYDPKS